MKLVTATLGVSAIQSWSVTLVLSLVFPIGKPDTPIVQEENTVRRDRRAIGSSHLLSYYFPNLLACLDHTASPCTVTPSPMIYSLWIHASDCSRAAPCPPAASLALRPYSHPTLHTMNTDLFISSQQLRACACFHAFV